MVVVGGALVSAAVLVVVVVGVVVVRGGSVEILGPLLHHFPRSWRCVRVWLLELVLILCLLAKSRVAEYRLFEDTLYGFVWVCEASEPRESCGGGDGVEIVRDTVDILALGCGRKRGLHW